MRSLRHSIGNPNEIHKSFQGYESLKSNLVEFPNLETPKPKNTIDPMVKSLRIKVAEMETILKISKERVRLLEKTVEEMSAQLENLQEVNRTLLNEKIDLNSSNLNLFVQDLIVSDAKKQLDQAYNDIEKYRLDSERSKKRFEAVLQENKRIEGSIKRYRKITSSIGVNKPQTLETISEDQESSFPSIKKNWGESPKYKTVEKPRIKVLPLIEQHIKEISEASTIPLVFTKTCNLVRLITSSQKVSLYLVSPTIQQSYLQYFQSIQHIQRVLMGNVWVQIHTDPSCDIVDPTFSKIEEVISGVQSPEKIVQCISLQKEPSVIIQCLTPPKPFDSNDSKYISIILEHMIASIKIILSNKREKIYKDQLLDIINVSAGIYKSRTHHTLANSVDQLLPKFFDFETAGLVFVDEENQELFTLAYSSNSEEKFSQDLIKYPIKMGLTGEAYKNKGIQIFENVKKKHLYNPEIDNIASASDLNNCLMSCLTGPDNVIFGILQLGNKIGTITQRDIQLVSGFSSILGNMISGINDISEARGLTIKMKKHLINLSAGLSTDINELSPDSSGIMDQLEIIKSMVSTWSKSKKNKP
jgi:hypothetical protein